MEGYVGGEGELAWVGGWEVGHFCSKGTSVMGGTDCGRKGFGGKGEGRNDGEELAQGLSGAGMEHSFIDLHLS